MVTGSDVPFCPACRTIRGEAPPPGGVVLETPRWMFVLRSDPPFVAGQGVLLLRRHAEDLSGLTDDEAQELGVLVRRIAAAYQAVLAPARVHVGIYSELVRHLHVHFTPRTPRMPASHIALAMLTHVAAGMRSIGIIRRIADPEVADVAARLRAALAG